MALNRRRNAAPMHPAEEMPSDRQKRFLKNSHTMTRTVTARDTGLGIVGRRTGIAMPQNIPTDSSGFVDLDLFFGKSPSLQMMISPVTDEDDEFDVFPNADIFSSPAAPSPPASPGIMDTASPVRSTTTSPFAAKPRTPPPAATRSPAASPYPVPGEEKFPTEESKRIGRTPIRRPGTVVPATVVVGSEVLQTPPPKRTPKKQESKIEIVDMPIDDGSAMDESMGGGGGGGDGDVSNLAAELERSKIKTPPAKKGKRGQKRAASQMDVEAEVDAPADGADGEDEARPNMHLKGVGRPTKQLLPHSVKVRGLIGPEATEASEDGKQQRRSGRQRMAPLAYWKNQRQIYHRQYANDVSQPPVVSIEETEKLRNELTSPPPAKKLPRAGSKSADDKKKKKQKRSNSKSKAKQSKSSDDETDTDADTPEAQAEIKLNAEGDTAVVVVAKSIQPSDYTSIAEDDQSSNSNLDSKHSHGGSNKKGKGARAGKAFESDAFASGAVIIPPGGVKAREMAVSSELLIVTSCAPGKLELLLNDQSSFLSKGFHTHIPAGNTYELKNHDKKKECVIQFVLVKGATDPKTALNAGGIEEDTEPSTTADADEIDDDFTAAPPAAAAAAAATPTKPKSKKSK